MTTRRRNGARGPRRALEWYDRFISQSNASNVQSLVDLSLGIATDEKKGMTVVRIIIDMLIIPQSINVLATTNLAIHMASADAFSALAVADADDQDEQPGWLWRTRRSTALSNITNLSSPAALIKEDLRAQRKFAGEDQLLILQIDNEAGSTVLTRGIIRVLCKKS